MSKKKNKPEYLSRGIVLSLRKSYPKGSRVELLWMDCQDAPPVGTLGTVYGVDDAGSILVHWDNGQNLNVLYDIDQCMVVDG